MEWMGLQIIRTISFICKNNLYSTKNKILSTWYLSPQSQQQKSNLVLQIFAENLTKMSLKLIDRLDHYYYHNIFLICIKTYIKTGFMGWTTSSKDVLVCRVINLKVILGLSLFAEIDLNMINVSCSLLGSGSNSINSTKGITNQFSFVYIVAKCLKSLGIWVSCSTFMLRTGQRIPLPLTPSYYQLASFLPRLAPHWQHR